MPRRAPYGYFMTCAKTRLAIFAAILVAGCTTPEPKATVGIENYGIWLELAEVKCRLGKNDEAIALIDNFDVALKVFLGDIQCFKASWPARERRPNARLPDGVFKDMCAEHTDYYGSLYGIEGFHPDTLEEFAAARRELERESTVLRRVCPRLGE